MAYDEGLGERIRSVLEDRAKITEKKMFGGLAFLLDGKMFVGIVKNDLMVRVGPEQYEDALKRPHVRPMDFTGRPMIGYVYVSPAGVVEDEALGRWVQLGVGFVATIPAKKARTKGRSGTKPERARSGVLARKNPRGGKSRSRLR
jgi:TfoX/Sxy family transcriptional regulator of competence genes